MNTQLADILDELRAHPEHKTHFTEHWSQGRAAFGGLVAALAVTAMSKLLDQHKPLRSLMVSFIGPLPPGEVTVAPKIVRQGKNVTQTFAEVIGGGNVCLQAMAVYGNPREAMMLAPEESEFAPIPIEQGIAFADYRKRLPDFLQFFEGAWVGDAAPFSGSKSRHLNAWVKHRDDLSAYPNEGLICVADLPPPVLLSHFDKPPVPASSITWSLEMVLPPEEIETEWFYLHYSADAAASGYAQQSGKIYDKSGRLCALSRQCMAYFG